MNAIAARYLNQGPTAERVKSLTFEALVPFLRDKDVIALTKDALMRVHRTAVRQHGNPRGMVPPENVNVHVFLAGYMVAYRPVNVFEEMGKLESELLQAAVPLLETFESILEAIVASSRIPPALSANFASMLYTYLKAFKAWKVPDEAKLTARIKHALTALYNAQAMLPSPSTSNTPADIKLRGEFATQITRLEDKLQLIAGQATLDETRDSARASAAAQAGNGLGARFAEGGNGLTNEQLAHELRFDPMFQLTDAGTPAALRGAIHHRIRESFQKAFWDSLVDDLRLHPNPCFTRVFRVLDEIKVGIEERGRSTPGFAEALDEIIDVDFIKERVQSGAYDWECCQRLIAGTVGLIQRIQAPSRDAQTKARWAVVASAMTAAAAAPEAQPKAFCGALEFLLDRVNAMRIDAANASLRAIAPVVRDHGDDYENGKFQKKLDDGDITLQNTEAWLKQTVRTMCAGAEARVPTSDKVFRQAMLSLVFDTAPPTAALPETLLLDAHRIKTLQDEVKYLATAATVAVILAGVAKASDVAAIVLPPVAEPDEADFQEEASPTDDAEQQLIAKASAALAGMNLSPAMRTSAERCLAHTDEVHKIMKGRVHAAFASAFNTKKVHNITAMTTAKMLIPRIEKAAAVLARIAELNLSVHVKRYNDLIAAELAAFAPVQPPLSRL